MSPSQEKRFPEGALLAAAVLLGAAMVLAALTLGRQGLWNGDDDHENGAPIRSSPVVPPAGDGSNRTVPPGSAPPSSLPAEGEVGDGPIECPEAVTPEICEAARFVQVYRGRPFKSFPVVELLSDEAYDELFTTDLDLYRAEIEAQIESEEIFLDALGLLDADVSLFEVMMEAPAAGSVGAYDPETKQLVVRNEGYDLVTQLTVVHELTHALDDQWFDIGRMAADRDAGNSFSAVVEGNATRVEEAWRSQLDPTEQSQLEQDELSSLSPDDFETFLNLPAVIRELGLSPYDDGYIYMLSVVAAGGEAAADAALLDPPGTTEQILDLGTDRSIDPEIFLAPPPAGGEVVEQGRMGELMTRLWLGRLAAGGWGGDHYVTWVDDDGRGCITVDMVTDSEVDQEDLRAAAEQWASDSTDRSAETVTVEAGAVLRVTGCGS